MDALGSSGTASPGKEQLERLDGELARLIADARRRSARSQRLKGFWQATDVTLGLATAILAAVAGAAGLASTAGRVPAAILALTAAALSAATKFLNSGGRCDKNRKYRTAWEALDRDACFAQATQDYPGAESSYDALRRLLNRRVAIMEMDHDSVPPNALGRPGP